jgi:hypothetical protein
VFGPAAVNVHQLLDALRQQGELYLIGAGVRTAAAVQQHIVLRACTEFAAARFAAQHRRSLTCSNT